MLIHTQAKKRTGKQTVESLPNHLKKIPAILKDPLRLIDRHLIFLESFHDAWQATIVMKCI